MIYPAFSENTERGVTLYFPLENKNENELIKELEAVYTCYSAVGTAQKDGKTYVALTVDDADS